MGKSLVKLYEFSKDKNLFVREHIWQALNGNLQDIENAIFELFNKEEFRNFSSYLANLANIVDVLGSNITFKSLLEKLLLNQHALAKIQHSSYYHQNGFDKFVLIDNQYFKLRLHVWQPENIDKAQENIHDHRWAFASKVLYGSFQNQLFEEHEQGNIERYFYTYLPAYKDQKYDLKYNGKRRLTLLEEVNLQTSQLYCLAPDVLHRISQVNSDGCATLMLTGTAFRTDCRLFAERQILEQEKINVPFSQDYIASIFQQVIQKIIKI